MTAIVTDVHYRMSVSVITDLADAGVFVIACEYDDVEKPLGFYSRGVAQRTVISRENAKADLQALCEKVCTERGEKPAVIPVGAKTLAMISENRDELDRVCGTLIPDTEQLELYNDKQRAGTLAKGLGIPTPKEYELGEDFAFPVVVKPVCGEKAGLKAAQRYVIADNAEKMQSAYEHFNRVTGQPPVIQEYLSGGGAGCSVLCRDGKILAHICHRRIREYPVTGGPSSCCEKIDDRQLYEYARSMVSAANYSGVAMFEFKAGSDGEYRFLEINPRVWGTYPLTHVCGSNFTYLWFLSALGLSPIPFKSGRHVKMAYYPSDIIAALGYLKRGETKGFFGAVADFFDPRVKNGLSEKSNRKPYRVYLKALMKRGR